MKTFDSMITLYGRMPVLELLEDFSTTIFRLHLAESNADADIMRRIITLAQNRNIEIVHHTKQALSRISKSGRQDQGVAIDVKPDHYLSLNDLGLSLPGPDGAAFDVIALDRVTNPQNLGMIIRSVAASPINGLLLPKKGCAKIDPLVHKASAGTLIKAPIFHCPTIVDGLKQLKKEGFEIFGLDGNATRSMTALGKGRGQRRAFVLGNESQGLSYEVKALCDDLIKIPISNKVESLNVAAAATLVAFHSIYQ